MIAVTRKLAVSLLALAFFACTQETAPDRTKDIKIQEDPLQTIATERPAWVAPWKQETEKEPAKSDAGSDTNTLLVQPIELLAYEQPAETIFVWRSHRTNKFPLVILSQTPFFGTVPESLQKAANNLVESADQHTLGIKATSQIASSLLLPQQAVAAALKAQFFSEVIWIFPKKRDEEISLEMFRQHMVESGTLWPEEAATLTSEGGLFRGKARGYPFTAATIDALPSLAGPCLIHLDLSYFSSLYRNEISTPLFTIVHDTLQRLRLAQLQVAAATLSLSNKENGVPLEIRFLKSVLVDSFRNPSLLDRSLPEIQAMRKDARYLESFFQVEALLTVNRAMELLAEKDASVQYDLYRTHWLAKNFETSLQHLENAISLDPGYSVEYLHLGIREMDKKRFEDGLAFLRSAARHNPGNPFVLLHTANALLETGNGQEASALLKLLAKEKWSEIYYPEMPQIIGEMLRHAGAMEKYSGGMGRPGK